MDEMRGSDPRQGRVSRRGFVAGGLALGGGLAGVRALGGPGGLLIPAAAAAAAQPKRGGTLIAAQEIDPVS
ncbi:MAG: hypothetical protein E6H03_08810, partial [Bacillati bacterium ANGP1]